MSLLSKLIFGALLLLATCYSGVAADTTPLTKVSYSQQIEPIFRTHCQGCHQPAKPQGEYVMTDVAKLRSGGESGDAAIVAGKPEESYLLRQIVKVDGAAAMPKKGSPLNDADVELVRRWIQEGAVDDRTVSAEAAYSVESPPTYNRLPLTTAVAFCQMENGWLPAAFMRCS